MGNQQRSLNADFVAGLVVGEGCFYISEGKRKNKKNNKLTPGFVIGMTDIETMDSVIEWAKDLELPLYIQRFQRGDYKPIVRIHVNGMGRTKKWVDFLIPYLTGEKLQAAITVQRFIESRLAQSYARMPYSTEEIALVKENRMANSGKPLRDYT